MLFTYPSIMYKESNTFRVEFPDLEGCHTFGSSINEVMECSREALSGYLLTLLEDGSPIPSPSDILAIDTDNNSFTTLITCDIDQYKDIKAVKKTLTIPAWLNKRACEKGINFSKTLQEALVQKIQS